MPGDAEDQDDSSERSMPSLNHQDNANDNANKSTSTSTNASSKPQPQPQQQLQKQSQSQSQLQSLLNRSNSSLQQTQQHQTLIRAAAAAAAAAAKEKPTNYTPNNSTNIHKTNNNQSSNNSTNKSRPHISYKKRLNVVVVFCLFAMVAQIWSVRGGLNFLNGTEYSSNNMLGCKDVYEMLRDAPLSPSALQQQQQQQQQQKNAGMIMNNDAENTSPPKLSSFLAFDGDFPLPRNDTNHSLVVMVLSRRNAFKVRTAIRQTWASHHNNVYFVLGQGCTVPPLYRGVDEGGNSYCKVKNRPLDPAYFAATLQQMKQEEALTRQLLQEQEEFHDLLVMPHIVDMYRTLPAKLKFAYTFVHQYLPRDIVHWVLKVDDDFFVRIDAFETLLETKYYQGPHHPIMVGGDIRMEHAAHTDGKWKEVAQFPRGAFYPPFPLGSYGHVVTRPIVEYVATYQEALFDYQGEDVSIGIWLDPSRYPSAPTNTTFFSENTHMSNGGDCRRPQFYVAGHDISPIKMQICHRGPARTNNNNTNTATTTSWLTKNSINGKSNRNFNSLKNNILRLKKAGG